MFNDLLKGYNEDEYVYIIEGCLEDKVSYESAGNKICPLCGEPSWDICSGLVKDIRKAKVVDDLYYKKRSLKKNNKINSL